MKQAQLIILKIPFVVIGGILPFLLGDFNMCVSASVGFIALFGVAVLNGVVMLIYFNEFPLEGMKVELAVVEGAIRRFPSELITASGAALRLVAMRFATGPGSEIQNHSPP